MFNGIFVKVNLALNYTAHQAGSMIRVVILNSNSDFEISVLDPIKFGLPTLYLISCQRKRGTTVSVNNHLYNT
jgi:hypothetical protein